MSSFTNVSRIMQTETKLVPRFQTVISQLTW